MTRFAKKLQFYILGLDDEIRLVEVINLPMFLSQGFKLQQVEKSKFAPINFRFEINNKCLLYQADIFQENYSDGSKIALFIT